MSRKKGLSIEEKCTKALEYFHEQKSVFILKQLEKALPTAKGIVSQSVKDVVQSLVNDDLVCTDKIGNQNFFWSFPSQVRVARQNKKEALTTQITGLKRKREELLKREQDLAVGREDSDDRASKMARLGELEARQHELNVEIAKFSDMDPDVLEDMQKDAKDAIEAANRWIDNIFQLRTWCSSKGIDNERFDASFDTEGLDYVVEK